MASVQELLLAAQAKKSPFLSIMEGMTRGIGAAQQEALPRYQAISGMEEEAAEAEPGGDYKQIAKDAAKDGDWEAFVDAMCAYVDGHK